MFDLSVQEVVVFVLIAVAHAVAGVGMTRCLHARGGHCWGLIVGATRHKFSSCPPSIREVLAA